MHAARFLELEGKLENLKGLNHRGVQRYVSSGDGMLTGPVLKPRMTETGC